MSRLRFLLAFCLTTAMFGPLVDSAPAQTGGKTPTFAAAASPPALPGDVTAPAGPVSDRPLSDGPVSDGEEPALLAKAFQAEVTEPSVKRLTRLCAKHPADADCAARLAGLAGDDPAYLARIAEDTRRKLAEVGAAEDQYALYVDRNPDRQLAFLFYFDATGRTLRLIGRDLVSTGKLRAGEDSFLTPVGVFENLPENFSHRAQGTKNDKGWRGLGAKGSRVWDFGYQQAPRQFKQGVFESQMRLLMHATDPDQGEPRLGRQDSKGCVRVSAALNRFLDRLSLLDKRYVHLLQPEHRTWLFTKDVAPVRRPGSLLIVGDSSPPQSAER